MDSLSQLDDWDFDPQNIHCRLEDIIVMENLELHSRIEDQSTKIVEQELIIKELQKRISALESAVLWCGEQCFDQLSSDPQSNFKKIE